MAEYRTVKVSMWAQDEWFMDLDADGKLLWIYLFTNSHTSVAGIYKLPLRTILFESGLSRDTVIERLGAFAIAGKAFYQDGIVWVVKMRDHQATSSSKVAKRIELDVDALPDTPLKREYQKQYGMDTVSIPYPRNASETETETETETGTASATISELADEQADAFRSQYENILGTMSTAIYPEAREYMVKLAGRGVSDWWLMALRETVSHANRPGWQYMKAILEGWLAAGAPTTSYTNGTGKGKTQTQPTGLSPAEAAAADARQAEYERQIAAELAQLAQVSA